MPGSNAATAQAQQANQQAQMRRNVLRQFRKNTRKRANLYNDQPKSIAIASRVSAITPQVGLASRVWLYFDLTVVDSNAAPSLAKLPRGPFGFVKNLQFVTNLGSNNVWDCDGFHTHLINLSKRISPSRYDDVYQNGYDNAVGTSDYPNDPWFQYPTPTVQNKVYHVRFVIGIELSVNPRMNFTQGMINLQAPQLQASINITTGQVTDLYANPNADAVTIGGNVQIAYEYYQIPSPLRNVALPSGMLHCTLEQNVPILGTGRQAWQINRQGILLRLLQETVLNSLLAEGGTTTDQAADANPATAGIDAYELKLNNSDIIYYKPYWLQRMIHNEEFPALSIFRGTTLHERFDAVATPSSGDFRDAIDTEAVTTTEFATYINAAATLGASGTNYFNMTREILVPYGGYAAGPQNPAMQSAS